MRDELALCLSLCLIQYSLFISKFNIGKFSVSLALVIMEYTLIALLLKLKKKIIIAEH